MATRHRFEVDGASHTVVVEELDDRVRVTVDDGEPLLLDVTTGGIPGYLSIIRDDGAPRRAYVTRDGKHLRVVVGGRTFLLGPAGGAARGRGAVGAGVDPPGVVTAPLAGVVVEVRVAAGDTIEPRQVVAVIEAMKMQNEVQAPFDGTVTAVHCQAGARIEKGHVILDYDRADEAG